MTSSNSSPSGRSYRGMTPEQRAAQRRERFVEAGLNLFGNEGFHATTVRKLCKEAGLTDRYFYESYSSMEECLIEVYERCLQGILARLQKSLTNVGGTDFPEELISKLLNDFFAEMEDPRVAKVCMFEAEGVSDHMHTLYNDYIRRFVMILMGASRAYVKDWPLDEEETEVLGNAVVGGIIQATRNWAVNGYHLKRESLVNGIMVIFKGTQLLLGKQ
ncbi:TetR/AcrR family transcriptional regulator [uncultured Thalassolituus sp.]|uniref:TetR/AcrR family transcriptional regulator n=1 Tax=uncultured Thalassolituus sp. TaxID=285273 RepID=UPI00262C168A|nr:TetR/AcrR family transcriptional regulator [uncultured Thalassolituus sp.]